MTAQRSKGPSRRNTCRYCGMESEGNHPRELECIKALAAEIEKARRVLASHSPVALQEWLTTGIDKRTPDGSLSPPASGPPPQSR